MSSTTPQRLRQEDSSRFTTPPNHPSAIPRITCNAPRRPTRRPRRFLLPEPVNLLDRVNKENDPEPEDENKDKKKKPQKQEETKK